MPCFAANCAVDSSPRRASRATFALKSAEYRFRLPVIGSVLTKGRTKLNHLSEVRGPPHSSLCNGSLRAGAKLGVDFGRKLELVDRRRLRVRSAMVRKL